MHDEFEMNDLENLSYSLGIEFTEVEQGIIMHQSRYAREVLSKFVMQKSNPANTPTEVGLRLEKEPEEERVDPTTYRKLVGSLRYLSNTRLDLSFSVGVINRYMQDPRMSHQNAAKRIMHYLQSTYRVVKMGWNRKPTRPTTGLGRVRLKYLLQFSIRVDF